MFPLNSLITCSSLISYKTKNHRPTEKMKVTAGSTDIYGKTQKAAATNSKLKRKAMGTIKNPLEWYSFCSGKKCQKVLNKTKK